MAQMLVATHGDRMKQTLVEAFDYICSLSAENSTAGEKWKTNSDYMINKRFIIPWITRYDKDFPRTNWRVDISYGGAGRIDDVIKALCYLTGRDYCDTTDLYTFVRNYNLLWGQWHEWRNIKCDKDGNIVQDFSFFRIRGYKKGTMHFEFVDEDVWYKFNQAVASVKGWQLPKQRTKS